MKNLLHKFIFIAIFLASISIPKPSQGQCQCEFGAIPDSVVQLQYFDSVTSINSGIVFNQFNPTMGILSCMKLSSLVTTVLTFDLFNKEAFADIYAFESFRRSRFAGPNGFTSSVTSPLKPYGPYNLDPIDLVGTGDEVHVGPDTVFNNQFNENYFAGGAGYLGTGTVVFDYLNTSTTTLLDGSSNYDLFVRGYTRLTARLVYYWCPQSILATNIKNFTAVKSNKKINISWITDNEESTNTYEIQISQDGRRFTGIGSQKAESASQGASAKYAYQYNPDQTASGKLYVRVKQTDANGKVSYSAIRVLDLDKEGASGFTLSPNPVVNRLGIQFDGVLNGKYKLDLTNQVGQLIHSEALYLKNQTNVQVNLKNTAAPGIYYLRIKDENNTQVYTGKVMIQR